MREAEWRGGRPPTTVSAVPRTLRCPKCANTFTVPDGQKPVCNKCGFGGTAGAKPAGQATAQGGATFNRTGGGSASGGKASTAAVTLAIVSLGLLVLAQIMPWLYVSFFGAGFSNTPWVAGPDFIAMGDGTHFWMEEFGDLWLESLSGLFMLPALALMVVGWMASGKGNLSRASQMLYYGASCAAIALILWFCGMLSDPGAAKFGDIMKDLNVGFYAALVAIALGFTAASLVRKPATSK